MVMTRQRVEAELAVTALTVNAVDGLRAVYFLRVVNGSASEMKFRVKRLSPAPFFTCKRHRRNNTLSHRRGEIFLKRWI